MTAQARLDKKKNFEMDHAPNSIESRDLASFLHGFTDLATLDAEGPHVIRRGHGVYVEDVHGRRFLEGNSGLWNAVAGFHDERLIEAGCDQFRKLGTYHSFFGRNTEPAIELAERLLEIAPVPMSKALFTNSGSEANDTAVKILWMIHRGRGQPERRKIISRVNAFHGVTALAASLTGKDYNKAFGLPFPEIVFAGCPHYWREGREGESEADFTARMAADLEELIAYEGAETIAGFIAEPVMGAGGVIVPPAGYFPAIQDVLERHGIPFIADEVICGLGRTGQLWGSQTYAIEPDIIVSSKSLTAGYFPLAAILISAEIATALEEASREFGEFPHGLTTAGHPVGCAIALKSIELISDGGLLANLQAVSPHFLDRLQALSTHSLVGEARGVGLMGALEIVADKETKAPFPAEVSMGERVASAAMKHGVIIRPVANAVVFAPPFIISEAEIDDLFDRVAESLDLVATEIG